jgi:hypothetical protein
MPRELRVFVVWLAVVCIFSIVKALQAVNRGLRFVERELDKAAGLLVAMVEALYRCLFAEARSQGRTAEKHRDH